MNHLVLIKLVDNRIHNLKGGIETFQACINNGREVERHKKLMESDENELSILEKQRQIIFDNYLLFDVK